LNEVQTDGKIVGLRRASSTNGNATDSLAELSTYLSALPLAKYIAYHSNDLKLSIPEARNLNEIKNLLSIPEARNLNEIKNLFSDLECLWTEWYKMRTLSTIQIHYETVIEVRVIIPRAFSSRVDVFTQCH